MLGCVPYKIVEGLLAFLKASPTWIDTGTYDKEGQLSVFLGDDLRLASNVGFNVSRLDRPAVFFKLLEDYLDTKRVDLIRGH